MTRTCGTMQEKFGWRDDLLLHHPQGWLDKKTRAVQLNEDTGVEDGVGRGFGADRGGDIVLRGRRQVVRGRKFDERKQRRGCSDGF